MTHELKILPQYYEEVKVGNKNFELHKTVTSIDNIPDAIEEFERQIYEDTEKKLVEIIQKYDFVVGSMELKKKLAEILPGDANIVYNPLFFDNPTIIYAIKKFDITDYLLQTESEAKP